MENDGLAVGPGVRIVDARRRHFFPHAILFYI